jgi:hypothetical protein
MGLFSHQKNGTDRSASLHDGNWQDRFDLYVVKKGDSLVTIAREVYGDGTCWPRIQEANPIVLEDPDKVNPGLVLRIPKGEQLS